LVSLSSGVSGPWMTHWQTATFTRRQPFLHFVTPAHRVSGPAKRCQGASLDWYEIWLTFRVPARLSW
jgi:hypothetical protein